MYVENTMLIVHATFTCHWHSTSKHPQTAMRVREDFVASEIILENKAEILWENKTKVARKIKNLKRNETFYEKFLNQGSWRLMFIASSNGMFKKILLQILKFSNEKN